MFATMLKVVNKSTASISCEISILVMETKLKKRVRKHVLGILTTHMDTRLLEKCTYEKKCLMQVIESS